MQKSCECFLYSCGLMVQFIQWMNRIKLSWVFCWTKQYVATVWGLRAARSKNRLGNTALHAHQLKGPCTILTCDFQKCFSYYHFKRRHRIHKDLWRSWNNANTYQGFCIMNVLRATSYFLHVSPYRPFVFYHSP